MKICRTCQHTYPDDLEYCPRDGTPLARQIPQPEAQLAAGLSRRFRLVRPLGKGGFGTVFLAEQIAVGNRPVALKVLNGQRLDEPRHLKRFQDEAASAGRIHHPNVVTIHDYGQADDGTPYIAMEFLKGESLRETLRRRGRLPVPEVVEILQQAARGLNAAHKLGIIHRDLKPDNIFLALDDEDVLTVKIVDFGIVKLLEGADANASTGFVGTPAYISYEQATGMKSSNLDARSDVYALGVVVYEMLTGRVPFQADSLIGFLEKHRREPPPPFRTVVPPLDVSPEVESAVMKALVKDRDKRYASAPDFARELKQAAQPPSPSGGAVGIPPTETFPDVVKIDLPRDTIDPSHLKRHQPPASAPDAHSAQPRAGVGVQTPPPLPPEKIAGTPGETRVNPHDGLPYVWIPAGNFHMGCSPGDFEFREDEKPRHEVIITKGFWLGQTSVTVEAYKRFAKAAGIEMPNPPAFNPGWSHGRLPIVNVGWKGAHAYCAWAGGRLPTEAEWEYAARGGSSEPRYAPIDAIAWYKSNSGWKAHPVGEKLPNAFGLFDMLGNVWEWVHDWYDEGYGKDMHVIDPRGPASGEFRVLRGGSWGGAARYIRASSRNGVLPGDWGHGVGFRCALDAISS